MRPVNHLNAIARSIRAFRQALSQVPPTTQPNEKEEFRRPKLGLALGGGFARGIVHVGALRVLEQEGIAVDYIAGTSVGSVVGAAYCSGVSAQELAEVAALMRFKHFARWTLSRYGFCSNDRMEQVLRRIIKATRFEELKIPLAVAATNFLTGEPAVFRSGPIAPAVRASCAYPGMFLPVEIDGETYVDGMLGHAVPTTPLREMGAERVIGIYLSAHWVKMNGPRHLFDVIGQCFSIAQARMSESWKRDADLVIEPNVDGFAYDCFERTPELLNAGEQAMVAALPTIRKWLEAPQPAEAALPAPAKPKAEPAITPAPAA